MSTAPIRFLHRYTGRVETETVYGEAWLRWAYETAIGRFALKSLAVRPWFSRWYGWRMDRPGSHARIRPFIERYGLDPSEFANPPDSFRSFNEFFFRKLRAGARPVDPDPRVAVFPADGRHLGFSDLSAADQFFVKGQRFDVATFLDDPELTRRFTGGTAVFSRLCPVDYHRFHFPVAGVPSPPTLLEGPLWSVSPIALRRNLAYLWRNRRWRILIETTSTGRVLMAPIGATNVGSAQFTYDERQPVSKGDEAGYFRFGGSAVLTLFEPGRVRLSEDLLSATASGLELYAKVGDAMAQIIE
ncbi:MAG: phosphatidylserine decarboxylase [Verrucomicrobiales bacterium]|nr:phosphatidylserine decarboxylase [Verrucomicrobiales bacterium]